MKKKLRFFLVIIVVLVVIIFVVQYLRSANIAVLNPKGPIAEKERNLILFALALSSIVVIPLFTLMIIFAWRYREGNKKAVYSPELDGNRIAETIWWLIPTAIIAILGTVAWNSSHQLDPYRPIASVNPSMNVEVVALDWKWLFIYPSQNIASVNFLELPLNTPVNFYITSDTVMNSFWIPQLGGQIYAMPGMQTQLHLMATQTGNFDGSSANISGDGFAGMHFITAATSHSDFDQWIASVKNSPAHLSLSAYNKLAEPSENNPVTYYSGNSTNLFDNIILKYMTPGMGEQNT